MSRLTRITVENLACFGNLTLSPGANTLLLGANGSGKSTLFDIIFTLRGLLNPGVNPLATLPEYQLGSGPARIRLEADVVRGHFAYELELAHSPQGFRELSLGPLGPDWAVAREKLVRNGTTLAEYVDGLFRSDDLEGESSSGAIPLVSDRSPLASVRFRKGSDVERFKRWVDGVWLLRLEPRRMEASAAEAVDGLATSGENFASWLLGFSPRKAKLADVVAALGGSISGLTELAFERSGREQVLVARFEGGRKVDFDQLSDGQRCLIVLHAVMVLASKDCSLLLLDEPDSHVTPTEIYPVFQRLRDRARGAGIQVMVASHHPHVIDLMAPDAPWELVQEGGSVRAEPFRVDLDRGVSASRHLLLRGRR